jgi:hypothetical protein
VVASRSFFRALACASSGLVLAIAVAVPSFEADRAVDSVIEQMDRIWMQVERRSEERRLQEELSRLQSELDLTELVRMERARRPPLGDFCPPGRVRRD